MVCIKILIFEYCTYDVYQKLQYYYVIHENHPDYLEFLWKNLGLIKYFQKTPEHLLNVSIQTLRSAVFSKDHGRFFRLH